MQKLAVVEPGLVDSDRKWAWTRSHSAERSASSILRLACQLSFAYLATILVAAESGNLEKDPKCSTPALTKEAINELSDMRGSGSDLELLREVKQQRAALPDRLLTRLHDTLHANRSQIHLLKARILRLEATNNESASTNHGPDAPARHKGSTTVDPVLRRKVTSVLCSLLICAPPKTRNGNLWEQFSSMSRSNDC